MKTSEIENQNEILNVDTIDEVYNELLLSVSRQIVNLRGHLGECIQELKEREKEGKRPTILQKNVLLKLHNDLYETEIQEKKIKSFRELYEILTNNTSEYYEKSNQQ